uniref:Uncharacterized protein n=1 Tax=Vespula pensylvanica TaxID=30213 RepID=A0A834U528_VESPE|nr:hypothetical protein H0235_011442 [Vespula pensylvanica]
MDNLPTPGIIQESWGAGVIEGIVAPAREYSTYPESALSAQKAFFQKKKIQSYTLDHTGDTLSPLQGEMLTKGDVLMAEDNNMPPLQWLFLGTIKSPRKIQVNLRSTLSTYVTRHPRY